MDENAFSVSSFSTDAWEFFASLVSAVSGGVWLGAFKLGYGRKKKYTQRKEELIVEIDRIVEPAKPIIAPSQKTIRYSELGQAARAYIGNLKTQQFYESQSAIDLIETRQLLMKAQAEELRAAQQQEDEDEAVFLLMF